MLGPVGEGPSGVVYRAFDDHTGSPVAIKALAAPFGEDDLEGVWREAERLRAFRHPNACALHAVGIERETFVVVTDYLDGETLHERMSHAGIVSVADTVAIGTQILDALAAAHAAGVRHRDLRPPNVFITTPPDKAPFVRLIDFGLVPTPPETDDATEVTEVMPGSPQAAGRPDPEISADLWRCGLTMFQILTAPFGYTTADFETLTTHIKTTPLPSALEFRSDVPAELDEVLAKALAKRVGDRYASAADFRTALITAWAQHRTRGLVRGSRFIQGKLIEETAKIERARVGGQDES
jgi:eukaryotic-like serine/threonine-protein kinase